MAAPRIEPDPEVWQHALQLAEGDTGLLEVVDDSTVRVWNRVMDWDTAVALIRAAQREPQPPVLDLELIRAAGGTHLVPRHSDFAMCGARITGPWARGQGAITCPTCTTVLPPEAD